MTTKEETKEKTKEKTKETKKKKKENTSPNKSLMTSRSTRGPITVGNRMAGIMKFIEEALKAEARRCET